MSMKEDLAGIVGAENARDDADILAAYGGDYSFVKACPPSLVVSPASAAEVQAVVKYANEHMLPVTPRSSKVGFHGAGIPTEGGIVVELSRMNKVLRVDPRNKKVKVEAGVTWGQLQDELAKQGMMVCPPLLPHRDKSVVTSVLEREPIVISKTEYSDQLATSEMVLPNGEMFWTGTALGRGMKDQCYPDAFVPGARLWNGAQGTLGIITWANIKAEFVPVQNKVFFIGADSLDDLLNPVYAVQRRMLGYECFILNSFDLAAIASDDFNADFAAIRAELPEWTAVLALSALDYLPGEKIAYEEAALAEIARELRFQVSPTVGGVSGLGARIIDIIRKPWQGDTYWNLLYKGSCHDIFFHTTMDRAPEFAAAMAEVAAGYSYPAQDIGVYLQPLDRARACCLRFSFHCDPDDEGEVAAVRELFMEASETAVAMGGFFTTPYGPWADMVFSRTAAVTSTLKVVKEAYDPNRIMNPGKLCF